MRHSPRRGRRNERLVWWSWFRAWMTGSRGMADELAEARAGAPAALHVTGRWLTLAVPCRGCDAGRAQNPVSIAFSE